MNSELPLMTLNDLDIKKMFMTVNDLDKKEKLGTLGIQ